jgi:hypothetical protein
MKSSVADAELQQREALLDNLQDVVVTCSRVPPIDASKKALERSVAIES